MGIRRFFWSEWGDSVHYGVDPVEPGSIRYNKLRKLKTAKNRHGLRSLVE